MANVAWNMPPGMEAGLEASSFYDPPNFSYPFGAHVAVVEVDPETGHVDAQALRAVDDCGPQINPVIVEGQVHGGVVQGVGQALWEEAVYDDNGQLLTGSLRDYAIPRADVLPDIEVLSTVTPSPHHPLGVKGHRRGRHDCVDRARSTTRSSTRWSRSASSPSRMPLTPERVWRAIQQPGRRPDRVSHAISTTTGRARSPKPAAAGTHPGAKLLAGGHSLIPLMKLRLAAPPPSSTSVALRSCGHRAERRRDANRRADDTCRACRVVGARASRAGACRGRGARRRPAGPQPRDDRRQRRARGSRLRSAERCSSRWTRRFVVGRPGRRATVPARRVLHGHDDDRARRATRS